MVDGSEWTRRDGTTEPLPNPNGWVVNDVVCIGSTVWLATVGGLVRYDGDGRTVYDAAALQTPVDAVTAIAADGDGGLWVLGSETVRLQRRSDATVEHYDLHAMGAPLPLMTTDLVVDAKRQLWYNGHNGVGMVDGSTWEAATSQNAPFAAGYTMMALSRTPDDRLWAFARQGTQHELYVHDTFGWHRFDVASLPLDSQYVVAVTGDVNGNTWFTGHLGTTVLVTHDGTMTTTRPTDPTTGDLVFVKTVAMDPVGRLWIGTYQQGLYVLTPDVPSSVGSETGRPTTMYPNPADHTVTIRGIALRGRSILSVIAVDAFGGTVPARVTAAGPDAINLDIRQLPAGLYHMVALGDGKATALGALSVQR